MQVFKLIIDLEDDTGLTFNALVDRPAHNKSLLAFDKEQKRELHFNDSKRMITGVAISANQLIYRFDHDLGDYYVYFEPKEVEKMVLKMSREQLLSSVNLMHDSSKVVNGITFIEGYFVSDTKRPPNDSENVQNGSYVMTYYVENEALYNEIKSGKYVGFSVEGIFDQIPVKIKSNNKNQNQMKKKNLFALVFGKDEQTFAEATTQDGVVLTYEGDLAVGTAVFVMDADGNQVSAPEGNHMLEDGRTIVLDANGIVTEVIEVSEEGEEMPEDVTLAEVVNVMKTLNENFEAYKKEIEEKFETLAKNEVPAKKKFSRKEGAKTWKDLVKESK
jgi:hypothetical protein